MLVVTFIGRSCSVAGISPAAIHGLNHARGTIGASFLGDLSSVLGLVLSRADEVTVTGGRRQDRREKLSLLCLLDNL